MANDIESDKLGEAVDEKELSFIPLTTSFFTDNTVINKSGNAARNRRCFDFEPGNKKCATEHMV